MLTDIAIKKALPRDKPYKLSDGRGLYLLVKVNGRKHWRYDYVLEGKRQTLALGEYPGVGVAAAREAVTAIKAQLKSGAEPMQERRRAKLVPDAADTFGACFAEWYAKKAPTWSATHAAAIRKRFEQDLLPDLGALRMSAIDAPLLLAVLQKIEKRGALYLVKRAREHVGTLFRYGIQMGRCQRDPSYDLRGAFVGHVEKHFPAIVDPGPARALLLDLYHYQGTFMVRQLFRLSVLVALRPGEVSHLEWSEVDLAHREIRIPGAKMKMRDPHLIPLSRQAVAILEETYELTGRGRFVFAGARNPRGDRPVHTGTAIQALYRLGYKGQMTAHGFRSMFSTMLHELGFRTEVIEAQLAHKGTNAVRAAYNLASHLSERRKLMQAWADHVDQLREGNAPVPGYNVVPFRSAG